MHHSFEQYLWVLVAHKRACKPSCIDYREWGITSKRNKWATNKREVFDSKQASNAKKKKVIIILTVERCRREGEGNIIHGRGCTMAHS